MKIALSKSLLERFKIYTFCVSISSEADWNEKVNSEFLKRESVLEISDDIIPNGKTKLTFDCYTKDARHIHLFLKDFLDKEEKELTLKIDDIFQLDISSLMENPGCLCPWLSPVVSSSGDLTICCNDSFFDMSLGDLNKNDIYDLWFDSEKIKKYRYSHISGNYENMFLCQRCLGEKSIDLSLGLLNEYTKEHQALFGLERYYKARIRKKKIIKHLMIETSSVCQNACIYCNQKNDSIKDSRGKDNLFIDVDKLKKLIKDFDNNEYFFENIHLFWLGEPLLHEEFPKILELLEANKELFSKVELHTNAQEMDTNIVKNILKINFPLKIHYSVDANTKDVYMSLKGNPFLEKVKENIQNIILETKEKVNIIHVLQFIVHKQNQFELSDFKEYWIRFFKENDLDHQITSFFDFNKKHIIYFRKWDPIKKTDILESDRLFLETRENLLHIGHEGFVDHKEIDKKTTIKKICFSPFEYLVIASTGKITFCCHDTLLENLDFNIFDHTIFEFEKKLKAFIEDHICDRISLCKECSVRKSINSHEAILEEVLYFCRRFNIDPEAILNKEFL